MCIRDSYEDDDYDIDDGYGRRSRSDYRDNDYIDEDYDRSSRSDYMDEGYGRRSRNDYMDDDYDSHTRGGYRDAPRRRRKNACLLYTSRCV